MPFPPLNAILYSEDYELARRTVMNETITNRISKLRDRMSQHSIDAYLVVSDGFHASEYVSDYFKTRAYLSGFTGSAGSLLVMKDWAGLWTDGRYFLQAADQLKETGIELMHLPFSNKWIGINVEL